MLDLLLFGLRATAVFFFQAEDGIRVIGVTGVQTCALPISPCRCPSSRATAGGRREDGHRQGGRAVVRPALGDRKSVVWESGNVGGWGMLKSSTETSWRSDECGRRRSAWWRVRG